MDNPKHPMYISHRHSSSVTSACLLHLKAGFKQGAFTRHTTSAKFTLQSVPLVYLTPSSIVESCHSAIRAILQSLSRPFVQAFCRPFMQSFSRPFVQAFQSSKHSVVIQCRHSVKMVGKTHL